VKVGSERIEVAQAVLVWARTSTGLSIEQAASKLHVSQKSLEGWESGELFPTIKQLRQAAQAYKRPLAVLLLPEAPNDFDALRDFRQLGTDQKPRSAWTPELHAEFRRALSQREVFLELLELAPGSVPSDSESVRLRADTLADEAGDYLRGLLRLQELPGAIWRTPNEAMNACIAAVERLGILVVQTRGVARGEMRGFSVSEWPFPVVALNGSEWPRPRIFTLLHELCHLALNAGGLCDLHEKRAHPSDDDQVEHYCNAVAASALMPRAIFLSQPEVQRANRQYAWSLIELQALSSRFGASSEAILLRLVAVGKATWDLYWELKADLELEYEEAWRRQREQQREAEGGPSFYVVKARDLGHGYIASVLEAFRSRAITSMDAADYLDVRFDQIPKLEATLR
jgi:Zn-dependent peptidase ImmA (M78 family)/DNA-binding XRE family transcriptional regulator